METNEKLEAGNHSFQGINMELAGICRELKEMIRLKLLEVISRTDEQPGKQRFSLILFLPSPSSGEPEAL